MLGAALVAATGLVSLAGAHEGHDHGGAQRGGVEAKTTHYHFEAVFTKAGITLHAHGPDHKALDATRLAATAMFYHPSTPKPWFSRELHAATAGPGQTPTSLDLAIDLSKVPAAGVKVTFQVTGLPDPAEPTATFTVPFTISDGGAITVAKATAADQAAINVQKLCKVSGEELGSMGVPLKVTRGNKSVLVCCQGCIKEIKADPDKFFGKPATAAPPKGEHDHGH
jgi:hypothetical protein